MTALEDIHNFLACTTPQAWIDRAVDELPVLLVDHANCEKKAASTALNLMYRYISHSDLLNKMSRLAREELRHFEQVLAIMNKRDIEYNYVSPSRYASGLRKEVRSSDPGKLIDTLIVGAFIEARSCERFAALAPSLDEELADFYRSLLKSEARHYKDYLKLAQTLSEEPIDERVALFRALEASLIEEKDDEFRFHSGLPA